MTVDRSETRMHDLKLKAADTARFLRSRVVSLPRTTEDHGSGPGGRRPLSPRAADGM